MGLHFPSLTALTVEVCLIGGLLGQTKPAGDVEPDAYTYKRVDGRELQVYVFEPQHTDYGKPPAAMLVFRGGAWDHGSAEWTFGQARYFAKLGMVGISVEYRLANGASVSPFDAVEDARAVVRWVRSKADLLNLDPKRVVPNVLVLVSPALDVEKSARFLALAGTRRDVASVELAEHVRRGLPPIIILAGALDAAIPPETMVEFCEKLKQANRSTMPI